MKEPFPSSEFRPVLPRKKQKGRDSKRRPSLKTLIENGRCDLEQDGWLLNCQNLIHPPLDLISSLSVPSWNIICLGLGSPTASPVPRAQLAFLLELVSFAKTDPTSVTVFDPVCTEEDRQFFAGCGFKTPATFTTEDYVVERPTIFFMPHCDLELYENILQANWTQLRLERMLFICNSFAEYVQNNPKQRLEITAAKLLQIAMVLESYPLPVSSIHSTAFNSTSVQYVPKHLHMSQWFSDALVR